MKKQIFLGVDAGSTKHVCKAFDDQKTLVWEATVPNDHKGCRQVLKQVILWQKQGYDVWVAGEGTGGYLSPLDTYLLAQECKYVNISPVQFRHFREMKGVQPDKDDEKDAVLLAELAQWLVENEKAMPVPERDSYFDDLKKSSRGLVQMTENKVAVQNQLVSMVRSYWPEIVSKGKYFSSTDSIGLLTLLSNYATPQAIQKAGKRRIVRLLSVATRRDQTSLAERLIHDCRTMTKVIEEQTGRIQLVTSLAKSLLTLIQVIKVMERYVEEQLQQHPFGEWLLQQEGIGPRTAGSLMGECGDLSRFPTEAKLARYAGNGPIKSQSGIAKGRHWSGHRYNHRLKRVLLLLAQSRAFHHAPSAQFLRTRKERSGEHWKEIKKLARHLIRFLWRAWQRIMNPISQELLGEGSC